MKQKMYIIVFTVLMMLWISIPANAHKVNIFAWAEGGTVHTQSKFSGGRPAKDCIVHVTDDQGKLLLEGKTDENGEFSFQPPAISDMTIVLKASMGHMAEWKISSQEIAEAQSASAPAETASDPVDHAVSPPSSETVLPGNIKPDVTTEAIQKMIEESLDKKLAPLTRMLVQATDHRPGLTEIIGGIGYIIGLVGVAMYMASRKKDHKSA